MGKKSVALMTCDVCGHESYKVDGWLQWSQDHPYLDRDWIERAACPRCVADIKQALKNERAAKAQE